MGGWGDRGSSLTLSELSDGSRLLHSKPRATGSRMTISHHNMSRQSRRPHRKRPAIWIRPDRLLVLRRPSDRAVRQSPPDRVVQRSPPDQVVRQVRQLRGRPAVQRDLGHPYRLSDRLVRPVLQSSRRAPSRLRAQLLSRYASESPSRYFFTEGRANLAGESILKTGQCNFQIRPMPSRPFTILNIG
jgi:hypothetical protein